MSERFLNSIRGSGGGSSSKGGGSNGSNESDNTLRSDNRAKLLELISEGPCVGLVNGGTSIYLDKTPLINSNGSANFRGIQWDTRLGTPDQPAIPGNPQVETPFTVGVKVMANQGPVLRTIVDDNCSQVRVIVEVTALAKTDSNGNVGTNSVSWQVQVRPVNGSWAVADQVDLINQKCTSPYQQASMVNLPEGGAPWDIQVIRITPDSNTVEDQNDIVWDSYSEIVAGSFTYPNSALVYLDVDAGLFASSSIPARAYDWKGLIIQIPSNYDPEKRTYTGMWDGTFNYGWTQNPAWVFYDLITNNRYGLGEFVDASKIDKWSLYQIAQYCDQPVPDGYGGTEPRYTFNACINNRDEAYRVLQSITTSWRGMAFWSLGQVFATIDAPADAVKLVTPANVIGGHFNYAGTALKARHSVALVSWNDPNDFYQPAIEVVINNEMLQKFGWRETTIQAIGCTTRSSAHRYGKWLLDTEQYETETVTYQASWDHATVKPGDIINIADPNKAGTRTGGRVKAITSGGQVVQLDKAFVPEPGSSYNFLVAGPSGGIEQLAIVSFNGDTITLSAKLQATPNLGAMWIITGTDVVPRKYSVLSVKEDAKNLFSVTALFHDPNKYARVEEGIYFDPIPYFRPKSTIKQPSNFAVSESLYEQNGVWASRLLLSWTAGDDFQSRAFHISCDGPLGTVDYGDVSGTSFNIENVTVGDYTFYLYAIGYGGQISIPISTSFTVEGWSKNGGPYISGLEIKGQGANKIFAGQDVTIDWVNNFPGSALDIAEDHIAGSGTRNPYYRDNIVTVSNADTGDVLRSDIVTTDTYTYSFQMNAADNAVYGNGPARHLTFAVVVRNTLGMQSDPTALTVNNPVPDMVVPNVIGGVTSVFVDYLQPTDRDYAGALIWMDTNPDFDPLTTRPLYDGPNNFVSIPGENLQTYYVRMACYDAFGKTGLNICPAILVFTGDRIFDKDPPAVPTGLTLVAQNVVMPTGEVKTALTATWDKDPSDNFSYYSVEIKKTGDENWIASSTNKETYQWLGIEPTVSYDVQIRAFSVAGYASNYAETATLVMPANTIPPGAPTALTVEAAFKTAFIGWTNPTDADLADVEVYVGTSADFTTATMVGKSYTTAFSYPVGTTGAALFVWIRAMNTSGLFSGFVGPVSATPSTIAHIDLANGIIAAENIIAGTITSDQIRAGSIVGDSLAIDSYLPATMVIGKTGITMGAVSDPATLVNANSTVIQPGKILISGNTHLSDWQNGTDATKIDGGNIAANTVSANKLTIGSRGVSIVGIQFGYDKVNNIVNWTAGRISFTDNLGVPQTIAINAGSFQYNPSAPNAGQFPCAYIAWQYGNTGLSASMVQTDVTGANFLPMATYRGYTDLVANYGRTIIDGSNIITGSITAAQLYVGELITNAAQINGGLIQNVHLAGNISFDKMAGGTLSVADAIRIGGDRFALYSQGQVMQIRDAQGVRGQDGNPGMIRVSLGKIGTGATDYGLNIFDASGNLMLSSGSSAAINVKAANVSGLGSLALANVVTRAQTSGFGAFSAIDSIQAANSATFIASAAIQAAMIGVIDTALVTTSGSVDVHDGSGNLRVRMGALPGDGDYGLKIWDRNFNIVLNSSGLAGTFINDLTVGTGKISSNAVSVTAAAYAGGINNQVQTSFSLDQDAQVLITFTGTAIASSNSTAQGNLYVDGNLAYTATMISVASSPITGPVAMTYMLTCGAGNHSVTGQITGTAGVIQPHDLSITVTALKR